MSVLSTLTGSPFVVDFSSFEETPDLTDEEIEQAILAALLDDSD